MKRLTLLVLLAVLAFGMFGPMSTQADVMSTDISGSVLPLCTSEDASVHIMSTDLTCMVTNVSYSDVLGVSADTGNLCKYVGEAVPAYSYDFEDSTCS